MKSVFACLLLFLTSCGWLFHDPNWDRSSVERALDITIPTDAQQIIYEGHQHGAFIDLRFEAPPQSALQFAARFCKGQLIQGFDPFNSVIAQTSDSHPIDMGWFIYYAYSPDTPSTLYGIRCPFDRLTVEQSDPSRFTVHLRREFHYSNVSEVPVELTGTDIWTSTN